MAMMDAIGVVVTDMARTLAFYRLLGLEFPEGSEHGGHIEAVLAGGIRLMFDSEATMKSFDADFVPPSGPGRVALAFLCDSPSEVDALHDSVVAAGYTSRLAPFDAFWGQRYATVLDPNGVHVDLFAPLEAA